MDDKILLVDDDPMMLSSYRRSLREFSIDTACGALEALEKISTNSPFAVVLSDLRMPDMDGLSLLHRVRQTSPNTVRIIMTGNPDLRTAIGAVNEGNIFRYLEKPCPNESLVKVLQAAVAEYRRVVSEKEILARSSRGASPYKPVAEDVPLKRALFNKGDAVVVMADGLRQGEHGVVEEVLPTLSGNDTYQVCIIAFPSLPGRPTGRYFVKELVRATLRS